MYYTLKTNYESQSNYVRVDCLLLKFYQKSSFAIFSLASHGWEVRPEFSWIWTSRTSACKHPEIFGKYKHSAILGRFKHPAILYCINILIKFYAPHRSTTLLASRNKQLKCSIFRPALGCWALQTWVKICFFKFSHEKHKNKRAKMRQNEAKNCFWACIQILSRVLFPEKNTFSQEKHIFTRKTHFQV